MQEGFFYARISRQAPLIPTNRVNVEGMQPDLGQVTSSRNDERINVRQSEVVDLGLAARGAVEVNVARNVASSHAHAAMAILGARALRGARHQCEFFPKQCFALRGSYGIGVEAGRSY